MTAMPKSRAGCPHAALEVRIPSVRCQIRMPKFPPLVDSRIVRPTEQVFALGLVTDLELLRLKTLARSYLAGMPLKRFHAGLLLVPARR